MLMTHQRVSVVLMGSLPAASMPGSADEESETIGLLPLLSSPAQRAVWKSDKVCPIFS